LSQSRPEAIAVQVQGQDRMLSPGDTIGTGSEATVRVVMPGLSGTLLRVRRLAHWRVEVMCQCDHVEVDGEETTRVSFPIGANQPRREVVLTHGAALLRARFMAGAASRPAPVPVPDVVSLPPPRPDPDTGPDVVERRIGDHTTFGRQSGGVDIQIDDPSVAALHATLDARGQGKYLLRDRNRGSATLVEGRAIRWARIGAGDRFSIGSSTFTLIAGGLLKERRRPVAVRLAVTGLTAWYPKGGRGIRGITFGLRPREVLAVLGPSGSGKSTLFKAMVGELPIQAGSIFFDDEDLTASPDLVRDRLGYAPQADYLHEALSARQVLSFAASFRHARDLGRRRRNEEVERIARILGITDRLDARVSELSGGQKKRLSIAVEVVRRPALLLLDEPTSGLDPGTAADVMDMLRQIAEEDCTVVLTTHATDQLRDVSRVLVVSRDGGEAYCGSPANVMPEFGVTSYSELMRSVRDQGGGRRAPHNRPSPGPPAAPPGRPRPGSGRAASRSSARWYNASWRCSGPARRLGGLAPCSCPFWARSSRVYPRLPTGWAAPPARTPARSRCSVCSRWRRSSPARP
jgi:ABC-type multidrug transport system ATPase subunit